MVYDLLFKSVAATDHSNSDCLMITVMTHGGEKRVSSHDEDYELRKITEFFSDENCPTLKGKPKVIFIQSCRGTRVEDGIVPYERKEPHKLIREAADAALDTATPFEIQRNQYVETTKNEGDEMLHTPPIFDDFLLVRSTMPGYVSFRDPHKGTWFIQELCNELEQNGKKFYILDLLTHVNWKVSEYEGHGKYSGKKETLCISSKLSKLLIFNDKFNEAEKDLIKSD